MEHIYNTIDGWFDFEDLYSDVVKNANSTSHFVEIGSWMGKSTSYMAVEIINSNKNIKFDAIDTWQGSIEHTGMVPDNLYEIFLSNIDSVKTVINPIKSDSKLAVSLYQDDSLDFVFIDASHDYENVKKDIELWYPKVKSKGILSGHDYTDNWPDVISAVNEFSQKNNYSLIKSEPSSWVIYKR